MLGTRSFLTGPNNALEGIASQLQVGVPRKFNYNLPGLTIRTRELVEFLFGVRKLADSYSIHPPAELVDDSIVGDGLADYGKKC
jgi:hypothetical protein